MLRVWNAVLVAGAFCLSLFGTFLTRSGVISSIHSFTQSSIGAWFLGFIAVVAAASTALIIYRLPLLRSRTRLESLVSREAAFLYNNLFLVAFALTVLWGVIYPLVSEAVRGVAVTVGAPYYDFFAVAFGLPLVLLMGIGPLVAWRRSSVRAVGRSLLWPAGTALVVGILLLPGGSGIRARRASGVTPSQPSSSRRSRSSSCAGRAAATRWAGAPGRPPSTSLVGRNPQALRRLCRARGDPCSSSSARSGSAASAHPGGKARAGPVGTGRRLHAHIPGSEQRRAAILRRIARRLAGSRGGRIWEPCSPAEPLLRGTQTSNEVAIRSDWLRAKTLCHRRPVQPRWLGLRQGHRQSARQPHLARGPSLRRGRSHHALARRARATAARAAIRRGGSARARLRWTFSPSRSEPSSPSPRSLSSRVRSWPSRMPRTTGSPAALPPSRNGWSCSSGATGPRRAEGGSSSTTAPARSPTRTTKPRSVRCGGKPRRR